MLSTINQIKNSYLAVLFLFAIVCLGSHPAEARTQNNSLDGFLQEADLVLEGVILGQVESAEQTISGHVAEAETSVLFEFGTSTIAKFKVQRIHKGHLVQIGQIIDVFSQDDLSGEVNLLKKGKKYIVLLKRHKFKEGYFVMDYGRSEWVVFDYNGEEKVKSWYQLPAFRESWEYTDYGQFVTKLETKLSQAVVNR